MIFQWKCWIYFLFIKTNVNVEVHLLVGNLRSLMKIREDLIADLVTDKILSIAQYTILICCS